MEQLAVDGYRSSDRLSWQVVGRAAATRLNNAIANAGTGTNANGEQCFREPWRTATSGGNNPRPSMRQRIPIDLQTSYEIPVSDPTDVCTSG